MILVGVLFDVLFNLHKFLRFEARDPFQEKIRREDIFHSDWDRFAHAEYNRLAQEEEDESEGMGSGGYHDGNMDVDLGLSQGSHGSHHHQGDEDGAHGRVHGVDDEDDDDDEDLDVRRSLNNEGGGNKRGGRARSNSNGGGGSNNDNWSVMNDEESDEEEEDDEALLGNRLVQRGRR